VFTEHSVATVNALVCKKDEMPIGKLLFIVGCVLAIAAAYFFRRHRRRLVLALGPLSVVSIGVGLAMLYPEDSTTVAGILAGVVSGVAVFWWPRHKRPTDTSSG